MSTSFDITKNDLDNVIPLCVPEIRGNERNYIEECLQTNFVSSVGPFVERFENDIKSYLGTPFSVATVNGTAALHIALLVAGVQHNDEVIVSSLTFIAPANAVRYVNAYPVFIDAEPDYWQIDTGKLREFIENKCSFDNETLVNKSTGRRVKAIIPVHILGHPCKMDAIMTLARKYNLVVIEDATESLGAHYKDQKVGSLGELACFSFNGNKIITTGGGGMIVTKNESYAHLAKYLTTQAKDNPLEFIHGQVGYNYRLTNIQAALGCAQLELLDEYIEIKRKLAVTYADELKNIDGIQLMEEASWAFSTFWLYTILVDETKYGLTSRELINYLSKHNVQSRPLWQPMHQSPVFSQISNDKCPIAEQLNQKAVSLPSSVGLSLEQQRKVINLIKQANHAR
jgi:perosamine synthetase